MKISKICTFLVNHHAFILICLAALVNGGCKEEDEEDEIDTIFIHDMALEDVSFHQITYDRPTILVFPNLTTATNSIYFHQCVNIREVRFPNLVSVGGSDAINPYLYFHQNQGLEEVQAPKLTTVYGYVYFYGNSSLNLSRGICSIADVYTRREPGQADCSDGAVHITGNANNTACFSPVVHLC